MGVQLVRSSDMPTERSAIDEVRFTATVARFDAPSDRPGGWHHHGDHHIVAYLISGKVRVESGPGGSIVTEPAPGDLVHIEPGTVHRETYEGRVELVGFTSGSGPGRFDVPGPDDPR
ncbi:MAG TPA: cupin [Actinomycetota bacterium]|nr:cupin [Actinomycetota bacterium]